MTSRRRFLSSVALRGSGVVVALPLLEALRSRTVGAGETSGAGERADDETPHRMVCICNNLGLHADFFNPEGQGRNWKPSRYLALLDDFRDRMTVLTGVSHPEVDGGHNAEKSFLTTAPHPSGGSFRNTISLDQTVAERLGHHTRFPYLTLSVNSTRGLSWTRAGVPIPPEQSPAKLYRQLFLEGTAAETAARIDDLRRGRSVMDAVLDQARRLDRSLAPADRRKLDEYLTSVREVETNLERQQTWAKTPKPAVDQTMPRDIGGQADITGKADLMFDLIHLALSTDSTRFASILLTGHFIVPPIEGVSEGYHTLSHHGQNRKKLEQLAIIELEQLRVFRRLLERLHRTPEAGGTLLDRTMVLYGSNMGNASSHDNRNLPTILAGGQFAHGQHLAFDKSDNHPLANLYVSMLHRLGLEDDTFGMSGTKPLPGLELA